ncbi:hypothetical protein [Actibacterium sp. 188UL27-1]|uniref:hypothetical protein n=1 Tax=Actibacterium sp. 188UL27-1 TaxID=2786961 RepID=UPI00195866BC|nr:hypothetical protein [Actibacterium sp. 188UL27-1]MBM7069145.1 hypothetical protein [Actibacterium sp. 188UL27-1]
MQQTDQIRFMTVLGRAFMERAWHPQDSVICRNALGDGSALSWLKQQATATHHPLRFCALSILKDPTAAQVDFAT